MLNEKCLKLGQVRSSIRELYEYGKKRKAEIGEDNVFDFSLGNPNVGTPVEVTSALNEILNTIDPVILHGYTSAQGDYDVRRTVADYINTRFSLSLHADCVYMTCGAAAALTIVLNALINYGDEVITFSPYFPEYKVFVEHAGGKLITSETSENTFHIDFDKFAKALTPKTKCVIINSPNNPSGVVYGADEIRKLVEIIKSYSENNTSEIYLIADEPYRELVFDKDVKVPYIMNFYDKSIVCYSYSKSLSLPGERIGYIAVNNAMNEFKEVYAGICGAGRALGYVCAPNLFQQLVKKVYDKTSDVSKYKKNRDVLYAALTDMGYEAVKPEGAFYMFVKSLEKDSKAFAERAKKFELLLVPSDDFGCKGYVRISYCVPFETIMRALPAFKALADSYLQKSKTN